MSWGKYCQYFWRQSLCKLTVIMQLMNTQPADSLVKGREFFIKWTFFCSFPPHVVFNYDVKKYLLNSRHLAGGALSTGLRYQRQQSFYQHLMQFDVRRLLSYVCTTHNLSPLSHSIKKMGSNKCFQLLTKARINWCLLETRNVHLAIIPLFASSRSGAWTAS